MTLIIQATLIKDLGQNFLTPISIPVNNMSTLEEKFNDASHHIHVKMLSTLLFEMQCKSWKQQILISMFLEVL